MKIQKKNRMPVLPGLRTKITLSLLLGFFFMSLSWAQSYLNLNDQTQRINATGSYQDFKIPSNKSYLYLEGRGGDGGSRLSANYSAGGGEGANIGAIFPIGNGANQLAPNGIIRFVAGKSGAHNGSANGNSRCWWWWWNRYFVPTTRQISQHC